MRRQKNMPKKKIKDNPPEKELYKKETEVSCLLNKEFKVTVIRCSSNSAEQWVNSVRTSTKREVMQKRDNQN